MKCQFPTLNNIYIYSANRILPSINDNLLYSYVKIILLFFPSKQDEILRSRHN